jgi:hypothetical protein
MSKNDDRDGKSTAAENVCAFCDKDLGQQDVRRCNRCHASAHAVCWRDGAPCPTFGCASHESISTAAPDFSTLSAGEPMLAAQSGAATKPPGAAGNKYLPLLLIVMATIFISMIYLYGEHKKQAEQRSEELRQMRQEEQEKNRREDLSERRRNPLTVAGFGVCLTKADVGGTDLTALGSPVTRFFTYVDLSNRLHEYEDQEVLTSHELYLDNRFLKSHNGKSMISSSVEANSIYSEWCSCEWSSDYFPEGNYAMIVKINGNEVARKTFTIP